MRRLCSLYSKPFVLVLCLLLLSGCGIWKKYSANSQIKKVEKKFEEARTVEANRYVSDHYKDAENALNGAKQLVSQKKYDAAIQSAQEADSKLTLAIQSVDRAKSLLQGKIKEVNDIQNNIKEYITKAEAGGAMDIAPDVLESAKLGFDQINKELNEVKRLTEQKIENYEAAKNNANAVLATAQRAYNATLREQAGIISPEISDLSSVAEESQLAVYLPERYNQIQSELEKFRLAMEQENYEEAVNVARMLKPEFEKVINDGKKLRAADQINQATAAIMTAKEMGGLTYAPEYLQNAMESVSEAKIKFSEGSYDESLNLAFRSYENSQLALSELEKLAQDLLAEVKGNIEEARQEGAEQYAPDLFTKGKTSYGEASLTLTQGNIRQALDLGTQAKKLISDAFRKTKKLIAQEIITICEQIINTAISQGAVEYTHDQLSQTDDLLNKARAMFRQEEYLKSA